MPFEGTEKEKEYGGICVPNPPPLFLKCFLWAVGVATVPLHPHFSACEAGYKLLEAGLGGIWHGCLMSGAGKAKAISKAIDSVILLETNTLSISKIFFVLFFILIPTICFIKNL
jgi:hypothetical protein